MKNFRLLKADEIDCRVARVKQNGLSLLLYKDARCDMNILDETVGMMNWKKEYSRDNRNCTVSIWDDKKQQWISKEDTGTESNTEQEKGLASDSFKRACFNWGIGRELYSAPYIWITSDKCNIATKGQGFTCNDRFNVSRIGYDESERINDLQIVNEKSGEVVYELGKKITAKKGAQKQEVQQESVESTSINATKQKAITKFITDNGVPAEFVWTLYKVKDASSLTERQHGDIIKNITKIKERYQTVKG